MSLKVNGQTYSWGDVDVKIPGLVLVVQEISYDDEQDMEESYGKGNRPRGYGKGNYKASGKMSMLRDDYDDVLAYCKAKGVPFYGLEWPSVVVSYANEGERTRIDELKKVVPIKRSHKAAQGDKGIEIEVYSSKSSYFDWAKIRFTEQFQPKISLARKDPAAIELGYNNVFEEVFTGYVSKPYNGGGFTDEVTLKDEMLLLEETQINNTFLDTTPQEMIAYFLGKAGLSKMKLSSKGYPERKRLPIRQMNVIEAINAVHAAWNIKQPFFFSGGVFYWGEKPEQDKTYIFEYGVNIIALTRSGGSWELETVSAPFVRHSHKISVKHPKVSGEFEVSKVVSSTSENGFIRTKIYF